MTLDDIPEDIKNEMYVSKEELMNISQKITDVKIGDIDCSSEPDPLDDEHKYQRIIDFFVQNNGEITVKLIRFNKGSYNAILKSILYSTTEKIYSDGIGGYDALLSITDLWRKSIKPRLQ